MNSQGFGQCPTISFSDLDIIERLGRGATSHVFKVRNSKTNHNQYAMKVVDKRSSKYTQIQNSLSNQIQIHSKLNHPNIVKMFAHLQDKENHYLLTQFCNLGELTKIIPKKLKENELRMMTYQIALAIEFLHQRNILHCDIKPSNILNHCGVLVKIKPNLDKKICDFGFSTKLKNKSDKKKKICGTPLFMAPEIVQKYPFGLQVDCWSFGICIYILHYGKHPFKAQTEDQLVEQIKKCNFEYGEISKNLKDLLQKIFVSNPLKRLKINQILKHPFYSDYIEQLKAEYLRITSIKTGQLYNTPKKVTLQDQSTMQDCISEKQMQLNTIKKVKSCQNVVFAKTISKCNKATKCEKMNTRGLGIQIFKTNQVTARILEDYSFEVELRNLKIIVSKDGEYIKIYQNNQIQIFFYQEIPLHHYQIYQYTYKILNIIKRKTILKESTDVDGRFWIMANRIDFYAQLGQYGFHHNVLEYHITVTSKTEVSRLHPIEYIMKNNNSELSKLIKVFLSKQKQFIKQTQ